MPDLEDTVIGDVADFDTMLEATQDMDAVIHLTGIDHEWEGVLKSNLIGTYNMFEASIRNGVRPHCVREPRRGTRTIIHEGASYG